MKTIEFLNEQLSEEGIPVEDALFLDAAVDITQNASNVDIQVVTYMTGEWQPTTVVVTPRQGREHIEDVVAFGPKAQEIMDLLTVEG